MYPQTSSPQHLIDINWVPDLHAHSITNDKLIIGANVSLTETVDILREAAKINGFKHCQDLARHIELIANVPVRNVRTISCP